MASKQERPSVTVFLGVLVMAGSAIVSSGCSSQPATQAQADTQPANVATKKEELKVKQYPENPQELTDEQWKQRLSDIQYSVARKAGTERKRTGMYWDNKREGMYRCVCCGEELFSSETKYESGTGWPSFWKPVDEARIAEENDYSFFGSLRVEVKCKKCDAHLGHVFPDGPQPTGMRYCLNSAALDFEEKNLDSPQRSPQQETGKE